MKKPEIVERVREALSELNMEDQIWSEVWCGTWIEPRFQDDVTRAAAHRNRGLSILERIIEDHKPE